ncbi:Phototropic-responsive NPH3 family protein, putative isoform 2 [Hibiscus syriacus]|uniref:Phototropic-responsive NPH3 family protein, putative isoform 2 n=1 Tax=Hibiscus syriacus TaxID=106335 RepID=A0A6A2WN46_HIBSY|nr:Phototropic-responsive NPH3 family protein, putative isoform 2 [Hibiscus syriacus]
MYSVARFMETNNFVPGNCNLLQKIENSLDELGVWTWSDLLVALKHYQDSPQAAMSSGILEKCFDTLVVRLAMAGEATPCGSISSADSSRCRISVDSGSTSSSKHSFSRATWWFEDLLVLSPNSIEMLVKSMVSRKYNHMIISRFLFYYSKSKFYAVSSDEKSKVLEIVIDMLYTLDPSSISCKSLFGVLRPMRCSNTSKSCRNKLESMIGSQLDQATLDDLLIPSPCRRSYRYDVNLVLRLLKAFLRGQGSELSLMRMKKVSSLIDQYITEVAPDRCLKSPKFVALVTALPDSARDLYDELYHAMDVYLEVHEELSEEEKMKMCCALNYDKLSTFELKDLHRGTINAKRYTDLPYRLTGIGGGEEDDVYNDKLGAQIQRMQWRVMELEKVCWKMQSQMAKIEKPKVSNQRSTRSLPRMCS